MSAMKPIVVASANGHQFRNGGPETRVERAFRLMTDGPGDSDGLEALVEGVTIVELDPDDTSVGFGGLPNADGVVQLDACCMHGPRRRAGGVAALEGVATAAAVAHRVLLDTPHHLLAGRGAQEFAREKGFEVHDSLLSPRSRRLWEEWKRRGANDAASLQMSREGLIDANHLWGTINCNATG